MNMEMIPIDSSNQNVGDQRALKIYVSGRGIEPWSSRRRVAGLLRLVRVCPWLVRQADNIRDLSAYSLTYDAQHTVFRDSRVCSVWRNVSELAIPIIGRPVTKPCDASLGSGNTGSMNSIERKIVSGLSITKKRDTFYTWN